MATIRYREPSLLPEIRTSTPDEYRGDVCMELRDMGRDDLADVVGGWSDSAILLHLQGMRPWSAARMVIASEENPLWNA